MVNREISLENLTDEQKVLIAKFAYLNFNKEFYSKLKEEKIKVSEMLPFLKNPNSCYLGKVAKLVTGIDITPKMLIKEMEEKGLGELLIKDIEDNKKTGLFAIAFTDTKNNLRNYL